jgi:hypothetical protein
MDQGPLVNERIEAASRFLREFDEFAPVVVAFWLKDSELGRWTFYLASDRVDDTNYRDAYGEIVRIASQLRDSNFDPFRVRLLLMTDSLVAAALAACQGHPPKIPFRLRVTSFGGIAAEEVYFVQGPTGEYSMPTGREVLDQIIDREAEFFEQHGKPPRKIKLPVLMAYDLAKCGRDQLGDVAGRVFKDGIDVFEREGIHGIDVEIIRSPSASLELE